ncbi:outer membrane beta-barrel protein [Aureisphaera galaxeae]|uniref:OmpW family outer membrane protein n=1 Tax=Aureisphaera galaxeae TaxID=1538023 RepID=UPI00235001C5|nr:OmpW family outer membrane protein [Aureisphaera galaxeae]MDC8004387.1 outer membrane beta-barrel protein [Aureisphaera galaxeae]
MKKLLLLVAVFAFAFSAQAQTEKGGWFFGADAGVSFSSTKTTPEFNGTEGDDTTTSTFSITPSANYFVIDNLAVGLDLSFTSSNTKFDTEGGEQEVKSNSFGVIPNGTYFFGSSNTRPYIGAGAGLWSMGGEEDATKFSGLAIKGQGGVAIFLNDTAAVNIGVEYVNANLSNKEESDLKNKMSIISFGAGFSIFLK